jgi:hypothetical protein
MSDGRCSCGAYTESSSGLCGACAGRSRIFYGSSLGTGVDGGTPHDQELTKPANQEEPGMGSGVGVSALQELMGYCHHKPTCPQEAGLARCTCGLLEAEEAVLSSLQPEAGEVSPPITLDIRERMLGIVQYAEKYGLDVAWLRREIEAVEPGEAHGEASPVVPAGWMEHAGFWSEMASLTKEDVAKLLRHTQWERDRAVERARSRNV